jgi:hypothetical protein
VFFISNRVILINVSRELTPVPGIEPTPSLVSIASVHRVRPRSLWNWYNLGSRLVHLASGGKCLVVAVSYLRLSLSQELSIYYLFWQLSV